MGRDGKLSIVDVQTVGLENVLVHDEHNDRGLGFMLSRLSKGPHDPTPIGVFRAVSAETHPEHPEYGSAVTAQIAAAQEKSGPGDLQELLLSGATWTVD
jgi:2-oxoglutarate/2-oxoacid ferredoxin oxidoreductase subunit beta